MTYTKEELEKQIIGGCLNLSKKPIESLPDGLVVDIQLDISKTSIKKLPDDLFVGWSLNISNTPIETLPESFFIGGFLNAKGSQLKTLPNNLMVGRDLDISQTPIKSLPNGLTVGRNLNIWGTNIESLPENLVVGGTLYIGDAPIEDLPKSLRAGCVQRKRKRKEDVYHKLKEGDFEKNRYVFTDNQLIIVANEAPRGNNTLYIGKIKGENAVSDGTFFATCRSFKEGLASLEQKRAKHLASDLLMWCDPTFDFEGAITVCQVLLSCSKNEAESFLTSSFFIQDEYTLDDIINRALVQEPDRCKEIITKALYDTIQRIL